MAQKYIGFVEHNEWEGEDFGFYFPDTPENRNSLKKFEYLLESLDVLGDGYEIDGAEDSYTKRDLDMIEKGSGNSYMARVNFVKNPEDILPLLLLIDKIDNLPYKGNFTANEQEHTLI